jgi:hypothetical protein
VDKPFDLAPSPLCEYFLSGYLSKNTDHDNFPPEKFPALFDKYEQVFQRGLTALGTTKEALKRRSEFSFDSGDAGNLESGIALLRVVQLVKISHFQNIALVTPPKNALGADLIGEKNGERVCIEVKALTKLSASRADEFMEAQLYRKILDNISKVASQLAATAAQMHSTVRLFVCVLNWFDQSIYFNEGDFQGIVDKLERNEEQEYLTGIDGVWFLTSAGNHTLFLNERGKSIDQPTPDELC